MTKQFNQYTEVSSITPDSWILLENESGNTRKIKYSNLVKGVGIMGDSAFLAKKEFDGKRVDVNATYNNTGNSNENDIATETANTGKDMYIHEARVNAELNSVTSKSTTFRLYLNGVEVDKFQDLIIQDQQKFFQFHGIKGRKVLAGQIIKITAQNNNATNGVQGYAELILYEEDTGVDPTA